MAAYYNEIDPYAAQWLRNLIRGGHIAPGDVDERSIEDVYPDDLKSYTQCHFFAGVGVWSFALRRAGWPDDRPVWTGSCPCQPFSAAGAGAGFQDPRHLWPTFAWLIKQRKPAVVFGEQVASKAVEPWVDLVHADVEAMGYAFGAVPFPSAGVGAPHIRDRLYWVADANGEPSGQGRALDRGWYSGGDAQPRPGLGGGGVSDGLAHTTDQRLDWGRSGGQGDGRDSPRVEPERFCDARGLAYPDGGHASAEREQCGGQHRQQPQDGGGRGLSPDRLDHADHPRPQGHAGDEGHPGQQGTQRPAAAAGLSVHPDPVNGFWRTADWLGCRDGKWRPVEPGTFPLAHGATSRVGRLRAYGNAINAEAATQFVAAYLDTRP
ncbi:DNA cytosine methyltransferase [Pseudomonas chlororaphis]|uniref:DNA cytosine methyltransferase n=1 Tax=Pseudomonas chlororaphis TaxID=587753 RepID=UPI0009B8787D|nr:DNA cytosine methyltransferase [Pseudomonas chlororaphis]